MKIPILGKLNKDNYGFYFSNEIPIKVLNNYKCKIGFDADEFEEDESKEDFYNAIENFLSIDYQVLKNVESDIYKYYLDMKNAIDEPDFINIDAPSKVWDYITFSDEIIVTRRPYGDKKVYISLTNSCEWEPEHGLQIVFKEGLVVNKIGEYDGHCTNSDSYDNENYENEIYVSF